MALSAARISVPRGRPPGFAGGISGAITAHSPSVTSLGNRPPLRWYISRCCSVHIPSLPRSPTSAGESSFRACGNQLLGQALSASSWVEEAGHQGDGGYVDRYSRRPLQPPELRDSP